MSSADHLSAEERLNWLRLIRTPTIGPVSFWQLLLRFGSAGAALDNLSQVVRNPAAKPPTQDQVRGEIEHSEEMGIRLLYASDPDFPYLLKALDPVPPVLSIWGDVALTQRPCVAIVGSRNASAIGLKFTEQIARDLGEAGVTVVSGLARGVDAAAHHASLEAGTIGVLGGGVDHIYPKQNTDLHLAMRERGLLVSESPLGYRAGAKDFPRRNRLISGLSLGTVVIEAAERSGTLITARYALEQNRDVMAVPGSPLDPRSAGCNRLLRDGASLIRNAEDILEVIGDATFATQTISQNLSNGPENITDSSKSKRLPKFKEPKPGAANDLLSALSPTPIHRDDLIRQSGLPAQHVAAKLVEMELAGDIIIEADGRISRKV